MESVIISDLLSFSIGSISKRSFLLSGYVPQVAVEGVV